MKETTKIFDFITDYNLKQFYFGIKIAMKDLNSNYNGY